MFVCQIHLHALKLELEMPATVGADAKSVPIQIDARGYLGPVVIKAYNMMGKNVSEFPFEVSGSISQVAVDLSSLPSGKYIVVAEVNGQKVGTRPFIRDKTGQTTPYSEGNPLAVHLRSSSSAFFDVSPENPASVRILPVANGFDRAALYNLIGKPVYDLTLPKALPPEGLTLDFSSLKTPFGSEIPNGVYILALSSSASADTRLTQKVVVSR